MTVFKYCMLLMIGLQCFCIVSCNHHVRAANFKDNIIQNPAELVWQDSVIDLGTIAKGSTHTLIFHAKNTGKNPLLFQKIESTCGCTVVEQKITKPVLPGNVDSIVASFRISADLGYVERKIYILANTQQQFYVLRIKANIE